MAGLHELTTVEVVGVVVVGAGAVVIADTDVEVVVVEVAPEAVDVALRGTELDA